MNPALPTGDQPFARLSRRRFALVVLGTGIVASLAWGQVATVDDEDVNLDSESGPSNQAAAKPFDAGSASDVPQGISEKFAKSDRIFLIREGNKLSAMTATCTHKNQRLRLKDGQVFCAAHGSKFKTDGTLVEGPAERNLTRHGVSIDARGHLLVDKSRSLLPNDPGATAELA